MLQTDPTDAGAGSETARPRFLSLPGIAPETTRGTPGTPRPGEGILIRRIAGDLPNGPAGHTPRGRRRPHTVCPLCLRSARRLFPDIEPAQGPGLPLLCPAHARRWLGGYYGGMGFDWRARDGQEARGDRFFAGLAHVVIAGDGDPATLN